MESKKWTSKSHASNPDEPLPPSLISISNLQYGIYVRYILALDQTPRHKVPGTRKDGKKHPTR